MIKVYPSMKDVVIGLGWSEFYSTHLTGVSEGASRDVHYGDIEDAYKAAAGKLFDALLGDEPYITFRDPTAVKQLFANLPVGEVCKYVGSTYRPEVDVRALLATTLDPAYVERIGMDNLVARVSSEQEAAPQKPQVEETAKDEAAKPEEAPAPKEESKLDQLKKMLSGIYPPDTVDRILGTFFPEGREPTDQELAIMSELTGRVSLSFDRVKEILLTLAPIYGFSRQAFEDLVNRLQTETGTGEYFPTPDDAIQFVETVLNTARKVIDVNDQITRDAVYKFAAWLAEQGGKTLEEMRAFLETLNIPPFVSEEQYDELRAQIEEFVFAEVPEGKAEPETPSAVKIIPENWEGVVTSLTGDAVRKIEAGIGRPLELSEQRDYWEQILKKLLGIIDRWAKEEATFVAIEIPMKALQLAASDLADSIISAISRTEKLQAVRRAAYDMAKKLLEEMVHSLTKLIGPSDPRYTQLMADIESQKGIFWNAFEKAMEELGPIESISQAATIVALKAKNAVSSWFSDKMFDLRAKPSEYIISADDIDKLTEQIRRTIELQVYDFETRARSRGTPLETAMRRAIGFIVQEELLPLVGQAVPTDSTKEKFLWAKLNAGIFKVLARHEKEIFG